MIIVSIFLNTASCLASMLVVFCFFVLIRVVWQWRNQVWNYQPSSSLSLHDSAIDLTSLFFWVFLTGRRFAEWGWVWPRKTVLQNWQDANLKESVMVIAFPCFANYDFATKTILLLWISGSWGTTQLTFTCSKSAIETLEKGVKYVQS